MASRSSRQKIPPVAIPKYKSGADWRCFLAEFRELVRFADLRPSHQLMYLKQAVPDEAKNMLYQHKVETIEHAIDMLTELYEPVKDYGQQSRKCRKSLSSLGSDYVS